jgi:hypothetical protein
VVWQGKAKVHKPLRDNAVIFFSREIVCNVLPTQIYCIIFGFLLPPFHTLLAATSDS